MKNEEENKSILHSSLPLPPPRPYFLVTIIPTENLEERDGVFMGRSLVDDSKRYALVSASNGSSHAHSFSRVVAT